jgi:thioester reductase-like protein
MTTVLLTGATGMVGSQLLPELVAKGCQVYCLVRNKDGLSAVERLPLGDYGKQVHILQGDVVENLCGLSSQLIEAHCGKIDKVVHSAALLKFDESLSPQVSMVNETGTQNVINLAKVLGAKEFHYISTAYVAGKATEFAEQDVGLPENARNPYERSKQRAEELVRQWPGGHFSIYRLGIVIGSSKTGFTPAYDGYYGYLSALWSLRSKLRQHIGETVFNVYLHPSTTINLIPVDWVAQTLGSVITKPAMGQAFHLTHPSPQTLTWLGKVSFKAMGIPVNPSSKPVAIEGHLSDDARQLQRIINRSLDRFGPYAVHEAKFCNRNLRQILGGSYVPPAPISEELLKDKILSYAIEKNFGRLKRMNANKGTSALYKNSRLEYTNIH